MLKFSIVSLITNQFFLLFLSINLGLIIGNIKIKKFKLGTSGVLFISLFLSWIINYLLNNWTNNPNISNELVLNISTDLVQKDIFIFSLILFITSMTLG